MAFVGLLRRAWTPLVVLAVVGCRGFTVSRVRANIAREKRALYANAKIAGTEQFNTKSMVYEVFGPLGTVADTSNFDLGTDAQRVYGARLPWSKKIAASIPAIMGKHWGASDSNSIGCRVVGDGQVKAERVSNEVNAYTHCLVDGA